ncbi:NUDIX hydrolase [Brevibacillus borstelensis]|uniref:NUDIX hydrolase n=1 Tax=Brevibacillus borstelensis TaxID=45462 RepID=UPI003CE448EA
MSNVFTLCVVREDDKILVQKREKAPFRGYWNAPGGKVEPAETPKEACLREVMEETGLYLNDVKLRGIITVSTSRKSHGTSVLMLFESTDFQGEITGSSEGQIEWVEIDKIYQSKNVPDSFTYLLPYLIETDGLITGKFVYERDKLEVFDVSLQ